MADKTFLLEIVSPARTVLKEEVEFLKVKGADGELGILPNHSPLATALEIGLLCYTKNKSEACIALSGGFMEVANNKVSVLANAAEKPGDIDVMRAKAAKERAEERLRSSSKDIDLLRVEAALKRAMLRLKAAERR